MLSAAQVDQAAIEFPLAANAEEKLLLCSHGTRKDQVRQVFKEVDASQWLLGDLRLICTVCSPDFRGLGTDNLLPGSNSGFSGAKLAAKNVFGGSRCDSFQCSLCASAQRRLLGNLFRPNVLLREVLPLREAVALCRAKAPQASLRQPEFEDTCPLCVHSACVDTSRGKQLESGGE